MYSLARAYFDSMQDLKAGENEDEDFSGCWPAARKPWSLLDWLCRTPPKFPARSSSLDYNARLAFKITCAKPETILVDADHEVIGWPVASLTEEFPVHVSFRARERPMVLLRQYLALFCGKKCRMWQHMKRK